MIQNTTTNDFDLVYYGKITGLSGLNTGEFYFLSPTISGAITSIEPTGIGQISKPVLLSLSDTEANVLLYRGFEIVSPQSGGSSGSGGVNGSSGTSGSSGSSGSSGTSGSSGSSPGSATSTLRIVIGANRSNATAFYFNAFTRTADSSASPVSDAAFLIPASGLTTVTVYLRQNGNATNSTEIAVYKSSDGSDFSTATIQGSSQTKTVTQYTVQTYTFSGLTINSNDCIYVYCKPASGGSNYFGIVIVS